MSRLRLGDTFGRMLLVAAGGALALGYYSQNGLGERGQVVEHIFKDKGQDMAIMRRDLVWASDQFWVEPFDEKNPLHQGEKFLVNSRRPPVRIFNYKGTSDSGEQIDVQARSYSINGVEQ